VLNDSQFDDWMRGTLDQAAALMSGGWPTSLRCLA
jgi:hypothetical protein